MAVTTDSLVADIRKHSEDENFKTLGIILQRHEDVLFQTEMGVLDTVIECLDMRNHSLGVLAAIAAKLTRSHEHIGWPLVLVQMREFVSKFSLEQVKESPQPFCNLIHRFTELLCLRRQPREGIPIVQIAIERYSPTPTTLTAIHCDLVQLCLLAKNVKPVLPLLDQEYNNLLTDNNQLDVKYVLLFYYYGGMVYTCLHDYLKALLFFTVCLTTPTVAISAIMVAAYKKFVLVSLLKFGKEIGLPRYASHVVERALKPLCSPYTQLAITYAKKKPVELQSVVTKFQETYNSDGNEGLVKRLMSRVYQHSIQRLTHTFMTVGLSDVSSKLGLGGDDEAEKYIRDMIEDGEIHACLDQAGAMVSFTENPENYDSMPMAQHLDKQLQDCVALEKKLSQFDKELALDPKYATRMMTSGIDDDPLFHDEAL